MTTSPISVDLLAEGVLNSNITLLSRAITLIESVHHQHQTMAQQLLLKLPVHSKKSIRLGITGPPGVGKSTFIEAFGTHLIKQSFKVAALVVDPSSTRSGGSILGDKTRMPVFSGDPNAFVRPSPSGGRLGGITRATRESMLLCEAAGFNVILVETVGAGQNETRVADMVDCFIALAQPGAGDELQGIKKGMLELADLIIVNKADGEQLASAKQAAQAYKNAIHMLGQCGQSGQPTQVLQCSALQGLGMADFWIEVQSRQHTLQASGDLFRLRQDQHIRWLHQLLEDDWMGKLYTHPEVKKLLPAIESAVRENTLTVPLAVQQLVKVFQ